MAVATAAPITAMVGNVPIAVGFGNGSHAPAGYIVATVVSSVFSPSATRRWPSTYHHHRRVLRLHLPRLGPHRRDGQRRTDHRWPTWCSRASLIGIFSFFFQNFVQSQLGIHIHWIIPALLMLTVNAIPDLLRRQPDREGARRIPGDRDRHARPRRAGGAGQGRRSGGFRGRRDHQPHRCVLPGRRNRRCQCRFGPVLRLLVVGRLRIDRDVRRGVA